MMHLDPVNLIVVIPQAARDAAWKGTRKYTIQGSAFKVQATKTEEAATRLLRKQIEKAEAEKKAARFAALKERFSK